MAEASQKVADATSAAEQAQQLLSKAEARAESAEEAKIELSLKLAELAALQESAADVSGMPSKRATDTETDSDILQKRYATAPASVCMRQRYICNLRSAPVRCHAPIITVCVNSTSRLAVDRHAAAALQMHYIQH